MIKVYYEAYYNDYHRDNYTKTFENLTELEKWIFGQMQVNYSEHSHYLSIPTPQKVKRLNEVGPWDIQFRPTTTSPDYWIHMIENEVGIIFSDGKRTNGQKHYNEEVRQWLTDFESHRVAPKFNFV